MMTFNTTDPTLLKTKQHFEILDGLRGVAALCVVIFHFMEMVYLPDKNFIAHGFLAVDFFFCLSGFVIAYAYDDRMGRMGITEFFKSRMIRLHPLVILGSVLGLITFLFDPFGGQADAYSIGKVVLIFLASVFLIPFPVMEERAFNNFGLNAPSWSLFWEYVANIVYAFILYRTPRRILWVLFCIAAITLAVVSYREGGLLGGWNKDSFWDGGARILFSFLAGILIYRANLILKTKIGFIGLAVLLILPFIMPDSKLNWLTQLLVVLLYFPLLVSLGAGAKLSKGLKKLCNFSGKISYPLYMTHYAFIWMFGNYYQAYKPNTQQLTLVIIAGTILLLGFGYLAMVVFDTPVRKFLNRKRKTEQFRS